jgi:hypothetical protein
MKTYLGSCHIGNGGSTSCSFFALAASAYVLVGVWLIVVIVEAAVVLHARKASTSTSIIITTIVIMTSQWMRNPEKSQIIPIHRRT